MTERPIESTTGADRPFGSSVDETAPAMSGATSGTMTGTTGSGTTGTTTGTTGTTGTTAMTTGSTTATTSAGSGSDTKQVVADEAASVAQDAKAGGQQVAETAKAETKQVASEAMTQVRSLLHQVRSEVTDQAGTQGRRAAEGLRSLADELSQMASGSQQRGIATDLASQGAERARTLAGWLENREPGDLIDEVRRFARRRPGAFLAAAAAIGVVGGRMTRGLASDDSSGDTRGPRNATAPWEGHGTTGVRDPETHATVTGADTDYSATATSPTGTTAGVAAGSSGLLGATGTGPVGSTGFPPVPGEGLGPDSEEGRP